MSRTSSWLLAIACVLSASFAFGGDAPAPTDGVGTLIQQLDAPEFAERQEASRKLSEAGKAAFPDVENAAVAGSREVATRAVEILRRHYSGGDLETRQAAEESLKRLAASGNPAAAQRANLALNPPTPATIPQAAIAGINPAVLQQLQLQQRGIQIQIGALAPAQNMRTRVRTVNGLRDIEVQRNGTLTKVRDVAGGGIEASVTEIHPNGKENTRKIEAKDLDDLKKKDPGVAHIYETYGQGGRGILLGVAPDRLPGDALPAPAGALPGAPPIPAARSPESIKQMMEMLDRNIERYKVRLPNDPSAQQRIDSLEQTRKRFEEMLPKEEAKP